MNTILMAMEIGVIGVTGAIVGCIILIACLYFVKGKVGKKNVGGGGGDTRKEDGRPLPPKNEKYKETN